MHDAHAFGLGHIMMESATNIKRRGECGERMGEKRVERQREREYTEGRGWLGSCGEEGREWNGRGELSGKEVMER